ncbi:unnamed protein product, partial [Amoebophrya sp. A25]
EQEQEVSNTNSNIDFSQRFLLFPSSMFNNGKARGSFPDTFPQPSTSTMLSAAKNMTTDLLAKEGKEHIELQT